MSDLYKFRENSEKYVEEVMKQVACNMTAVVGAALSARLISISGKPPEFGQNACKHTPSTGRRKGIVPFLEDWSQATETRGNIPTYSNSSISAVAKRKDLRALAGKPSIGEDRFFRWRLPRRETQEGC